MSSYASGLLSLPDEVISEVLSYCDVEDLLHVERVCCFNLYPPELIRVPLDVRTTSESLSGSERLAESARGPRH